MATEASAAVLASVELLFLLVRRKIVKPRDVIIERPILCLGRLRIPVEIIGRWRAEHIGLNTGKPALALCVAVVSPPSTFGN